MPENNVIPKKPQNEALLEGLQGISLITRILSQIICVLIYGYYLVQAQNYTIKWSLLTWLLPTGMIMFLNNTLSSLGIYIIMIPLALIIASWYNKEDRILKIANSISCGLGIALIISNLVRTGVIIPEYINFRFLQIAYTMPLQEKEALFFTHWDSLIHAKHIVIERTEWLTNYMEMNYHNLYQHKLIPLTKDKIVPFADTVFKQANLLYANSLNKTNWWKQIDDFITVKHVLLTATGVITIGIILLFANAISSSDASKIIVAKLTDNDKIQAAGLHELAVKVDGNDTRLWAKITELGKEFQVLTTATKNNTENLAKLFELVELLQNKVFPIKKT